MLRLGPREMGPNVVELVDRQHRGYVLVFTILPKEATPERERENRDPDFHRRTFYSDWEKLDPEVVKGPTGWLPEADWLLPVKRKVYRIELAAKPPEAGANDQRIYIDDYLVLFTTGDNRTVVVKAFAKEDHIHFREQVEAVIKSFQFGPSEGQPMSPAVTPTPTPSAGQPQGPAAAPKPPF
jgi:hypothetical protein